MHESSVANMAERGVRARSLTLGAAMGIVISLFGVSVPLAAIACETVMRALDAAMAPPTFAVTSIHPILFLLMTGVIAGLLLGKERVLRPRAAIAVNVSAAVIATVIGVGMLVAVIMPLIMIGKSIAGE
jgi:hypothetical protein